MSEQSFDDLFKEKLQNYSSPVDEGMWDRIVAAKEKDKKTGFWMQYYRQFGAGIIALLFIGALYFSSTNQSNSIAETKANKSSENSSANNNLTEQLTINEATSAIEISENKNGEVANTPTQPQKKIAPVIEFKKQTAADNIEEITTETDEEFKSLSPNNMGEKSYHQSSSNRSTKSNLSINHPSEKRNAEQVLTAVIDASPYSKNKKWNKKIANEEVSIEALQSDYKVPDHNKIEDAIALLGLREAAQQNIFFHNQQLNQLKAMPITDCPSAFGDRKNDWFAEAFISPDFAIKTTKGLDDEYLRRKDSTESFRSAFTAGVRLSKNIGENLMLKTGLQFSQINEKFNFRSENERKQVTVITVRTIVRAPGDTLRISDTSILQQIGYRVKTTFNRYRSFDIPLIIGYEWGNNNFRTSINTGLIFNLQSWQQGDMLDTTYNAVSFDKAGSQVFKKNIGLGIYASAALFKRIGTNSEVFAESYLRYNISNMTNSASPFNQKFHVAGINVGVRYKINGGRQR